MAPIPSASEDVGVGANFSESDSQDEDDDRYSVHKHMNSNKVTIGIQTSSKHFSRVEKSKEFISRQTEIKESIDWA